MIFLYNLAVVRVEVRFPPRALGEFKYICQSISESIFEYEFTPRGNLADWRGALTEGFKFLSVPIALEKFAPMVDDGAQQVVHEKTAACSTAIEY